VVEEAGEHEVGVRVAWLRSGKVTAEVTAELGRSSLKRSDEKRSCDRVEAREVAVKDDDNFGDLVLPLKSDCCDCEEVDCEN
jgi:hypothetical protein